MAQEGRRAALPAKGRYLNDEQEPEEMGRARGDSGDSSAEVGYGPDQFKYSTSMHWNRKSSLSQEARSSQDPKSEGSETRFGAPYIADPIN